MTNGYVWGQLAGALTTAAEHEDGETRRRAERRTSAWIRTIGAIASGRVVPGSRTPVAGLPAWVTLEVLRGGFATGSAVAEGPLEPDERELAERLGVRPERGVLFWYFLTDEGLAELDDLLERRAYRVVVPEDAALLTVAWLLSAGDRAAALDLVDELAPLADRLRLAPRRSTAVATPADHVFRATVAEAQRTLAARRPRREVEAQREAVRVWNPFADRLLALWWERADQGRLDLDVPDAWRARARDLLTEHEQLARTHTLCTKHRRPKENLAILLAGTRELLGDGHLTARRAGLVLVAVTSMAAKRGTPGSTTTVDLRREQEAAVRRPAHAVLARLAAGRLDDQEPAAGLSDPEAFATSVTSAEASEDVPEGTPMPAAVGRVLGRARSAPVEQLLAAGVVPSAEVLAGLVPAISASVLMASYPDLTLGWLMALDYQAFRRRRSLLLVDLAAQVRLSELPWVSATEAYREADHDQPLAVVRGLGALALDHFPGTLLPNPLVRELQHLLKESGSDLPLTEELAADIFMGRFSPRFARAGALAQRQLAGTLYARYYDLDRSPTEEVDDPQARPRWPWSRVGAREEDPFSRICLARAGHSRGGASVAANGTVIEQGQVLTTHNLAALVSVGVRPARPWLELADAAVGRTWHLLALAQEQRRPLATVKDAAYAWRQALFFASTAPPDLADAWARTLSPVEAVPASAAVVGGLRHVVDGGRFDDDGRAPGGQRFLGWTTTRHWVLPPRDEDDEDVAEQNG